MSRGSCSPDMAAACEVRQLAPADLKALVPEWDELAAAAAEPNPFYESWALLPALEAFADGRTLCAAVFRGGRLEALFPLEREARWRGLPARALRSWRHRHLLLCAPLVRAGAEADAFSALLRWAARSGTASIVELHYLPGDGALRAGLAQALDRHARGWSVDSSFERALLTRAESAEAYIAAALDGDRRRELKRKERRLKEAASARYVRLGRDGDGAKWIEDFLRLEAGGWKGKAGGAFACRDVDRRFAQTLFLEAFRRGRLLATGLDVDGKPVARELCLAGGAGSFSFKIAYDEAFGRYAPGLLVELENIRAFHDTPGLQWMDSFTSAENTTIGGVWKGRRRIERIAAAVDGWGAFVRSLVPLARWAKQKMRGAPAATAS